ncbi:hypothetical protein HMPREF1548_06028 [Clostridium sp. KLE 1755]|nr:hypothetical protein HMPREF1548_06028 [Clostridium sp. KLE 1755]
MGKAGRDIGILIREIVSAFPMWRAFFLCSFLGEGYRENLSFFA